MPDCEWPRLYSLCQWRIGLFVRYWHVNRPWAKHCGSQKAPAMIRTKFLWRLCREICSVMALFLWPHIHRFNSFNKTRRFTTTDAKAAVQMITVEMIPMKSPEISILLSANSQTQIKFHNNWALVENYKTWVFRSLMRSYWPPVINVRKIFSFRTESSTD